MPHVSVSLPSILPTACWSRRLIPINKERVHEAVFHYDYYDSISLHYDYNYQLEKSVDSTHVEKEEEGRVAVSSIGRFEYSKSFRDARKERVETELKIPRLLQVLC